VSRIDIAVETTIFLVWTGYCTVVLLMSLSELLTILKKIKQLLSSTKDRTPEPDKPTNNNNKP